MSGNVPSSGLAARGFQGVLGDLRRRGATYVSDWKDGLNAKVPAATLFLFFACLAPAIAFGGLMSSATDGAIGVMEMILATAACGVIYAIVAGQPLTILGGTGPLLVFTSILYLACGRYELPFLSSYAWVGLWACSFTLILAFSGASRLIARFTRFTDETFAALISIIFVVEAVRNVLAAFPAQQIPDDSALFGVILALGTYIVASALARLRHTPYLRATMRNALADFGPAIAVLSMVVMRRLLPGVDLPALAVPSTIATTSGRPWLVDLWSVPSWAIAAAALPGALVAVLVFLDQNITIRIIHSPENKLRKGDAYHWDLALVGALIGACSFVGLPWLVAATVRSVNHVKALSVTTPTSGATESTVENRISPLLIHALIGVSLMATAFLRVIPMAVLYGLFLYMGIASMRGNQFFERLRLWLLDPARVPADHFARAVPPKVTHLFTAVQLGCLACLWLVKTSAFGILFPLFIALLVPIREFVARKMDPTHLRLLDAEETAEDAEDDLAG
jgi:hypothetical protein